MTGPARPPELVSGEGVALELSRAGVGSRLIAGFLDLALQLVSFVVVVLGESVLTPSASDAAIAAMIVVDVVVIFFGYPLLMEWLNHGRTLGKLAMGLRAVRDDGGPLSFRQALVRALSGLLLETPGLLMPLSTCVGVLSIMLTSTSKRIGDMLAGTFVLNERSGPAWVLRPAEFAVPYQLQGWASTMDLSAMSDQLALSIRQYLTRAGQLTPAALFTLGEQLKTAVLATTSPAPPWDVPAPELLATVLAERRRRSEPLTQPYYQPVPQYQPMPQYPTGQQYQPTGANPPPATPASGDDFALPG